ncbi:MAG: MarR family transcriptional regulator [Candidatus Parcubacteria bacterium]|nr:MarR family transcriptional regulator [Candidatus Parcubacteria bacterium]
MEQIKTILKNIGLTATETAIYLAGLDFPSIGVKELEKITGIKRTTIYHALNTLMQKGLVANKGTATRLAFIMTNPKDIKRLIVSQIHVLEDQQKELDEILPLLQPKNAKQLTQSNILHYEGIAGIKLVVEQALYCKSRHWDIIAPNKNFFSEFDKKYADYFIQTRQDRQITARSLWENNPGRRSLTPEEIKDRNPRYLPQVMEGHFKSVMIIFDDKVAIISSLDELSAILIQSPEIHDLFNAMFEGLWLASKEYERNT